MQKNIKVIFDTNVWISFLIGKRLSVIKSYIVHEKITLVITEQLLVEIKEVTSREKLNRYFPKSSVSELITLLEVIALKVSVKETHTICNDPKDNFLLDLIEYSKSDYLVTGDKELLKLNPFKTASIITPSAFEQILNHKK